MGTSLDTNLKPQSNTSKGPIYKKVGGEIYAVKRNDRWEFVEPRDLHTSKYYIYINSDSATLDDGARSATGGWGKKVVNVNFFKLE